MENVTDYTYPVTFDVTVKVFTGYNESWFPAAGSGSGEDFSVETEQTFSVTINEPCTQTDITYASSFGTMTTTVGTSTNTTILYPSISLSSNYTACPLTYTLDPAGICSFCTLNTTENVTLIVDPPDDPANVGTYYIELETCYSNHPEKCADIEYITVVVTSPCSTIVGGVPSSVSSFYVFQSSSANVTLCYADEDMGTDCAITWSLEPDVNTPATLQGSIANSITLNTTYADRLFTATSTDWIDVGTYTFTLSCYFENYPTSGAVTNTISVTVNDCDSSAENCECGWL